LKFFPCCRTERGERERMKASRKRERKGGENREKRHLGVEKEESLASRSLTKS